MPSANFTCSICLEVIGNQHPCIIDHDKTCMECLEDTMIPKFEAALRFEYHYPPRWGSMPLYVDEFSEFFDPVFLQDYAKKEQEYRTPIRSRVYCHHQVTPRAAEHDSEGCQGPGDCTEGAVECGTFLGKRSSQKDNKLLCPGGEGAACSACGAPLSQVGESHDCLEFSSCAEVVEWELGGQVRGDDFQACPGCGVRCYRTEGCNHMDCHYCRTAFCYTCGEAADPTSAHWDDDRPCDMFTVPSDLDTEWLEALRRDVLGPAPTPADLPRQENVIAEMAANTPLSDSEAVDDRISY